MSKTFPHTIHYINGKGYAVWQAYLKEYFPWYEGRGNPIRWFGRLLDDPDDLPVIGVKTKKEALEFLVQEAERQEAERK